MLTAFRGGIHLSCLLNMRMIDYFEENKDFYDLDCMPSHMLLSLLGSVFCSVKCRELYIAHHLLHTTLSVAANVRAGRERSVNSVTDFPPSPHHHFTSTFSNLLLSVLRFQVQYT